MPASTWLLVPLLLQANHECLYEEDIPECVEYEHVQLVAKVLPPPDAIDDVARIANDFWRREPDKYIAIHCAYGEQAQEGCVGVCVRRCQRSRSVRAPCSMACAGAGRQGGAWLCFALRRIGGIGAAAGGSRDTRTAVMSCSAATAVAALMMSDSTMGTHCVSLPEPLPLGCPPALATVRAGFNRTGFVVCAYLIQCCGLSVEQAMENFAEARPPGVKHEKFINELYLRYGSREDGGHSGSGSSNGNTAGSGLGVDAQQERQQRQPGEEGAAGPEAQLPQAAALPPGRPLSRVSSRHGRSSRGSLSGTSEQGGGAGSEAADGCSAPSDAR